MKRAVLSVLLLLPLQAFAAKCERADRSVTFGARPTRIYIAPREFTEVIFPEAITGFLPEAPKGLKSYGQEHGLAPERMFFSAEDEDYQGLAMVHGASGNTYHIEFVAQDSCADLTVRSDIARARKTAPPSSGELSAGRKLMEYMVTGQPPSSYDREKIKGSLVERLVYRQGSVSFYLSEIWHGYHYTGVVLLAVNGGRVPFRVGLESIDYSSPELRKAIGRVAEISMWPYDFRLGAAPEFATDAVGGSNEGLVFVVSENQGT